MYLLPSNGRGINKASILKNVSQLIDIDENRFRSLAESTGDPAYYYQVGRMVVLYPTPTSVQTIVVDAKFRPQPLLVANAATQKPILQPEWNEGLLRLATSYDYTALIEPDRAANAGNQVLSGTRRQKEPDAENDGEAIKSVGGGWRGG